MFSINLCKGSCSFGHKSNVSTGLVISGAIAAAWLISLIFLLSHGATTGSTVEITVWILLRTFLHTGLFVIAHDAIHGNVSPQHPAKNRWVGQLALALYGFLPYQTCCKLHWQHHAYPAQTRDPDFYPRPSGWLGWYFVRWYYNFISNYLTGFNAGWIVMGVCLTISALFLVANVAMSAIVLFWLVPWILSSLQLFIFGVFLPHYTNDSNQTSHQPRSYYYPIIFSLLACYHFSYHREHHTYPHVPWYQLPNILLDRPN